MFPLRLAFVLLSVLFTNFNTVKCINTRDINPDSSLCSASDYGRFLCDEECKNIVFCLGDKRDVVVETCQGDDYCFQPTIDFEGQDLPTETLCSPTLNSCNNTIYPIPCNTMGKLPDPNDCHWYHLCSAKGENSLPLKCQKNHGFNALTQHCTDLLVNDECVGTPLLPCKCTGFVGVSEDRPALWFYCRVGDRGYVHEMDVCDFENPFDLDQLACPEWLENDNMKR